jgi:pimeloyl-ACP methyl ester carboxylesterase/DNA-binding CsgD family transcriptional regulator
MNGTAMRRQTPPVQYVTTKDGYGIAYTDFGAGEPLIKMPVFLGSQDMVWNLPELRRWMHDLAARMRVVSYDARGQGLSTRGLPDTVTLDDFMLDFEAVREQLGLDRFMILGSCNFALQAVHYAVRHPERVRALILVNAALSWEAWRLSAVYDRLPVEDWEMFLYNMSIYNLPPEMRTPEFAQPGIEFTRRNMTQSDYLASVPAWHSADVGSIVSQLKMPTLVLHSKDFRLRSVEAPREFTRLLPNGRLVVVDGYSCIGDRRQAIQAIDEFVAELSNGETSVRFAAPGARVGPRLPPRQAQVLRLIAEGKTNGEIADELVISLRTVERHVAELYARIGVRNRVEAAAFAMKELATA